MHEQFINACDNLKDRVLKVIGAQGIDLSSMHYADDDTRARFTRQGRVLIEHILPAHGINLYIASQAREQQTDI